MDLMRQALTLARKAQGRTSPNPPVGAVVVSDGQIVGEGHTQPAGSWHAEVMALRQAGERARGGTVYVTLEPCCHYGRTPPCTKAIIEAGVAEVHAAMIDPNPAVGGKGLNELEANGIRVVLGEMESEAREMVEGFTKFITTGLPFFTLKWAMSLDGKIATRTGDSKWITGDAARARAHDLRDSSDAIIVGINTVIADDPQLTVRVATGRVARLGRPHNNIAKGAAHLGEGRDPSRVVVDSTGRIPLSAKLLGSKLALGTIVATTEQSSPSQRQELAKRGAEVLVLPDKNGHVDLGALARSLAARGIVNVMVEGGGTLLAAMIEEGLADKLLAFVAPKIVGGREAPGPIGGSGIVTIGDAMVLGGTRVERVGEDFLIVGYIYR